MAGGGNSETFSYSIIVAGDVAGVGSDDRGQRTGADALADEPHRAIAQAGVEPRRMEGIDFGVVGAGNEAGAAIAGIGAVDLDSLRFEVHIRVGPTVAEADG